MPQLLLHACCAPCSLGTIPYWQEQGYQLTLYYDNPNIQPYEEYLQRLQGLKEYTQREGLTLSEAASYNLQEYLQVVAPLGTAPNPARCAACYRLRLQATAKRALALGYATFSTTLLISPYQNQQLLQELGAAIAAETGLSFADANLQPRFRDAQNQARALGIYRQKYCGCLPP